MKTSNSAFPEEGEAAALPAATGFSMPGEFEPHSGCIMIWPERPGSWSYGAEKARAAFSRVIQAIAESETVYVAASPAGLDSAVSLLFRGAKKTGSVKDSFRWDRGDGSAVKEEDRWRMNVELFPAKTDDAWSRDMGPTFVARETAGGGREVRGVNWKFNAWGGEIDGLYAHWDRDDRFAGKFCELYGYPLFDASPFVLEGGSVHSDGEGTLLVTEACLLSAGRNPGLTPGQIEERLKDYLGAEKVLWLPRGIYGDETNEHVDNICAFLKPGEVVLAWTDNREDPQYALSRATLSYLESVADARGRKLRIHKLPIPDVPIRVTEHDLAGFTFEEGEDTRSAGERLAASYVNFYFSNGAVVMPAFGGENESSDNLALSLMKEWVPDRKIVMVPATDILKGGGNIHCITQQIPAGTENEVRKWER